MMQAGEKTRALYTLRKNVWISRLLFRVEPNLIFWMIRGKIEVNLQKQR